MAGKRDYAAENARRNERARQLGYSSYRALRDARAKLAGKPRDYALERERADIRARGRGFLSSAEERRYKRTNPGIAPAAYQKMRTLAYFGISESRLNKIRTANKKYDREYDSPFWQSINRYDYNRDNDIHNWSPDRVGYILAYHAALVNPKTNWDAQPKNPQWISRRVTPELPSRINLTGSQYFYLVQYSNLYQIDEFEARYGHNSVENARRQGKVKP